MAKKNLDGKMYYYLLDEANLLHICSDGKTVCGLDTTAFSLIEDTKLSEYTVCVDCTATQQKVATFKAKAELVDEPVRGRII